jgi:hypothetical protein
MPFKRKFICPLLPALPLALVSRKLLSAVRNFGVCNVKGGFLQLKVSVAATPSQTGKHDVTRAGRHVSARLLASGSSAHCHFQICCPSASVQPHPQNTTVAGLLALFWMSRGSWDASAIDF